MSKIKKTVTWAYVMNDLNSEEDEKELQKEINKNLGQKNSLKKETNYMSNRRCDFSFNSWIDKKNLVE